MNKFEVLITTGKLEIQLKEHEVLLTELSAIQKGIIEGNFANAAIAFGRFTELSSSKEISEDTIKNIKLISDFFCTITASIAKSGNIDEVLNTTVEELDFTVRDFNRLKRAGLNTARDILNLGTLDALEKTTKLGKKGLEEVKTKMESLGFILSDNNSSC